MTDAHVNDDGADPSGDMRTQNSGETAASDIGKDDPHKVETLAKQDDPVDPDAGSD